MERRREERFETDRQAIVTVLDGDKTSIAGRVVNASGRGLRLLVDRPIPVNSPVRVDLDGQLLLGEVCYTAPEGADVAVGLSLDQVLHDVTEVAKLVDAILGEGFLPVGHPRSSEVAPALKK